MAGGDLDRYDNYYRIGGRCFQAAADCTRTEQTWSLEHVYRTRGRPETVDSTDDNGTH